MINGKELVVYVYYNNLLILCMAPFEWKLWSWMWAAKILKDDWPSVSRMDQSESWQNDWLIYYID